MKKQLESAEAYEEGHLCTCAQLTALFVTIFSAVRGSAGMSSQTDALPLTSVSAYCFYCVMCIYFIYVKPQWNYIVLL